MTISNAKYAVFKIINAISIEANRQRKQVMKYLSINPSPKAQVGHVHTEKVQDNKLKTITARGTKVQFDTKRHWQPVKWKS
ncbi:hypothetical protein FNH22_27910 [Fulvivirga sp. M361]|uniref:hypothetical protein n=1 Tax=Fulvivirga sp. M361 TaxID=2594266 RepID=UPI001179FA03|nr:hypothetical protein [Fulvivirga sp. M361]TRX49062.1 hypothetical protein FNH22_27910 [Fulvivirga sp. M361]